MIKTYDVLATIARQLERANDLLRVDAIAVSGGITAHVFARQCHGNHAVALQDISKQNAAAFVRIAALGLPADEIVISLADLEH